jgi:hypothetical protein
VSATWLVVAAVAASGGMGLYWRRRVRGKKPIEQVSRKIHPSADHDVRTPVPEWAEQTRC